jgi:N-acetylmuramoyl-L-alanine amidase
MGTKNGTVAKNIALITVLAIAFTFGSFTPTERKEYKVRTVVIDPGHGGKDSGTVGAFSKEKDIALKIALELGDIIKKYLKDVEVIYTRNNDTFVPLEDRALMANRKGADVFISIHCNSLPANTPVATKNRIHGTETFVMGLHTSAANLEVAKRENSVILLEENYEERYEGFDPKSPESHILFSLYQNAYLENSLNLADKIEVQFKERVGRHSRGVKQAGFWVLYRTSMPSVLVEAGFLSNPNEEKYLNDPMGQTYIASGIFRAFRDYKNEIEAIN